MTQPPPLLSEKIAQRAEGRKNDQQKARVDLLSGPFLLSLGRIMGHGAVKYGEQNWRLVARIRYIAAMGRHLFQYMGGESLDNDSGESHLTCLAANAMILWEKDRLEDSSSTAGSVSDAAPTPQGL